MNKGSLVGWDPCNKQFVMFVAAVEEDKRMDQLFVERSIKRKDE